MSSTHVLFYPREAKIPIRPSVYVNSSQYNQLLARDPALVSWVVILPWLFTTEIGNYGNQAESPVITREAVTL